LFVQKIIIYFVIKRTEFCANVKQEDVGEKNMSFDVFTRAMISTEQKQVLKMDIIVLCAGKSKRMKSKKSKIFHEFAGQSVIDHAISGFPKDARPIYVISEEHDFFKYKTAVIQDPPRGTGDAVKKALPLIKSDYVFVICGDTPLITQKHYEELLKHKSDIAFYAVHDESPTNTYGRIIEKNGRIEIREYKDATEEEKNVKIVNSGFYLFSTDFLKKNISFLKDSNAQGEFYLTDLISMGNAQYVVGDKDDFYGINTREDLIYVNSVYQKRKRNECLQHGVTLKAPETVFFSYDTHIGQDCVIEPYVTFGPGVTLEEDVIVYSHTHIEDSYIKEGVKIGPFAHLRGGNIIEPKSEIGNFVEVKKSTLGAQSKAKHLSYIGDTQLGERVNVGAGVIVCNYDGRKKHKTTIGHDCFIGSNSVLVSPLTIAPKTLVAAGTVVTEDVADEECLIIGRVRAETKYKK
jgi:bifunctional UDP-N-acetylglucosamine pyrophosphorylase/glucosamine-1-phosphate N-acetyltransferase